MAMGEWDNLQRQILGSGERKQAAAARALHEGAGFLLEKSKELCPASPTNATTPGVRKKTKKNPFYTGHPRELQNSGTVDDVEVTSNSVRVVIKYTARHAAAVHEMPQPAHGLDLIAKHPDVQFNSINEQGQWKFLAKPVMEHRDRIIADVAAEVNRA